MRSAEEDIKKYSNDVLKYLYIAFIIEIICMLINIQHDLANNVLIVIFRGFIYFSLVKSVENNNVKRIMKTGRFLQWFMVLVFIMTTFGLIGLIFSYSRDYGYLYKYDLLAYIFRVIGSLSSIGAIFKIMDFMTMDTDVSERNKTVDEEVLSFSKLYLGYMGCSIVACILNQDVMGTVVLVAITPLELLGYKSLMYWNDARNRCEEDEEIAEEIESSELNKIVDKPLSMEEKVEILKGYKELLDSGIITLEEFEAKKNEVLR